MSTTLLDGMVRRRITAVHRVFYLFESELDTSEGRLELVLGETVIGFRAGPDGQSLVVEEGAWEDPFAEPLSSENREYVRTHGQWTLVDVSQETGWSAAVGHDIQRVTPVLGDDFVAGATIDVGAVTIEVNVEADELHAVVSSPADRHPTPRR